MGESSLDGRAWVCGARGQEFESLFSPLFKMCILVNF